MTLRRQQVRRVVAETSGDRTNDRFPLLILDGFEARDVQVAVAFKPVSGRVDQAAGIVVRLKDANNYYIARANALEDNVRLYKVVGGKRSQFAGKDVPIPSGLWETLRPRRSSGWVSRCDSTERSCSRRVIGHSRMLEKWAYGRRRTVSLISTTCVSKRCLSRLFKRPTPELKERLEQIAGIPSIPPLRCHTLFSAADSARLSWPLDGDLDRTEALSVGVELLAIFSTEFASPVVGNQ